MEHFDKLMSLVENEIEAINRNGKFKSREEIDSVYKLVDIAKDIECMNRWEEEMDGESYDDGMSYARTTVATTTECPTLAGAAEMPAVTAWEDTPAIIAALTNAAIPATARKSTKSSLWIC